MLIVAALQAEESVKKKCNVSEILKRRGLKKLDNPQFHFLQITFSREKLFENLTICGLSSCQKTVSEGETKQNKLNLKL